MKKTLIASVMLATGLVSAQTYVNPYLKSDGTMVHGHVRTAPNEIRMDNYGARDNVYGNTNPYTGQRGSQRSELTPLSPPPVQYNSNTYSAPYPAYPYPRKPTF